jgi:hypothetical protein
MFTAFETQFALPTPTKIETISQENFAGDEKYLFFNIGMGSGKTTQCLDYIKDKNFAWISPNIALANDLTSRTTATFYQDVKRKDKTQDGFIGVNQLLICMNSLHFVRETYDVIVLDEIETILTKWDGDFMGAMKKPNWDSFVRLIKSAKRVILLDAFTTKRAIDLMKMIDDMPMTIFEHLHVESTRTINYVKHFEQMLHMMVSDLRAGKKLFIYYPWKKKQANVLSMSNMHDFLYNATDRRGVFYNSEVDDKVKMQLGNINDSWSKVDFVITNNIITCGVNHDTKETPFDVEYLFVAPFSNPRDIVQVSFRPRYPTSPIMHLCHYGHLNASGARADDSIVMGPIYASMFKNTSLELHAPLKPTLRLFFEKSNYALIVDPSIVSAEIKSEVREAMGEYDTTHSYMNLPDIDKERFNEINQLIISRNATQEEKLTHQKHIFKSQFTTDWDVDDESNETHDHYDEMQSRISRWTDMVTYGWDNQLIKCASKIREMTFKPTSIFNRIAQENGFTGFPEDLTDLKLSTELRDEIFRRFKFKHLRITSGVSAILKNIYIAEFGSIYKSVNITKTATKTVLSSSTLNEYFAFVSSTIRPKAMVKSVCQCANGKHTDFCGKLLCLTCGSFALDPDIEYGDPDAEYFYENDPRKPKLVLHIEPAPVDVPIIQPAKKAKTAKVKKPEPTPKKTWEKYSGPPLYGYKIAEKPAAKIDPDDEFTEDDFRDPDAEYRN